MSYLESRIARRSLTSSRSSSRGPLWVASIVLAAALPGCGIVRSVAETPGRMADAVVPGGKQEQPSTVNLLPDLIRHSDLIVFRVNEASRAFEAKIETPEAALQAARWRLNSLRWATQLTAGPNSITGLLDLVVLCTTFGYLLEDHVVPDVWGEAALPMQAALQTSVDDGWKLLERYLTAEQLQLARSTLETWRKENPKLTRESLLEFPSFSTLAVGRSESAKSAASLMGMVGLDNLSGLEPAVHEIEQARQLGLRALFFAQRAPQLIGAEIEVRMLSARGSKEVLQVLDDTERITATLESVAATAAALPGALSTEREAALKQVSQELTAQREGLVADLEKSHETLGVLLRDTQGTLEAGKGMSVELTAALKALDAFVGRFDKPEDPDAPPPAEPQPPGKPFDIAEYGAAAERIGNAVKELNALVSELDTRLPEAQRLLDVAAQRGERSVDHVMNRVLVVGLALIAAALAGVWALRRFAPARR